MHRAIKAGLVFPREARVDGVNEAHEGAERVSDVGVGAFKNERVVGFSDKIGGGVMTRAIDAEVLSARGFEGEQDDVFRSLCHGRHRAV